MRVINYIKRVYYRIQYQRMLRRERENLIYPLEHRVHLRKKSFVVVDCEMGCHKSTLITIIKAYLASKIYEFERIPLIIVYRENGLYANKMIRPFLKKYESLRLKVWFYESPSVPLEMSVMGKHAMAYINANENWRELPSIDEELINEGTKVCMSSKDAHWRWMYPDMVICDNYKDYLALFKSLILHQSL